MLWARRCFSISRKEWRKAGSAFASPTRFKTNPTAATSSRCRVFSVPSSCARVVTPDSTTTMAQSTKRARYSVSAEIASGAVSVSTRLSSLHLGLRSHPLQKRSSSGCLAAWRADPMHCRCRLPRCLREVPKVEYPKRPATPSACPWPPEYLSPASPLWSHQSRQ